MLDVDDDIHIVKEGPTAFFATFPADRLDLALEQVFFYTVHNGIDLALIVGGGNDEAVSDSKSLRHIDDANILGFLAVCGLGRPGRDLDCVSRGCHAFSFEIVV